MTPSPAALTAPLRSRRTVFLICWLCLVADGYDLYVYGATLPAMIGRAPWNITAAEGGLVGSLALVGMLIGSLGAGMLTDRLGRRKLFVVSLTTFSVFMVACALAPSFAVFGIFRFLACVGVGGLLPTAVALATEFADPAHRSRILGAVLTGPAVGTVIASLVSLTTLDSYGFRPVYAIGGIMLLFVVVVWRSLPESPAFLQIVGRTEEAASVRAAYGLPEDTAPIRTERRGSPAGLFVEGRARATLLIWLATFCSLLTIFGIATWLPQIMKKTGYGLGSSVTFLLVYSIGAVIGTLIASRIAERVGPKRLVVVGFGSAVLALAVMSFQPPAAVLVVCVLLAGFGGLGTQNVLNDFIARTYPAPLRATGLGWALGVGRVGAIVGPTYGAVMVAGEGGLRIAALGFVIPAVLGAIFIASAPAARRASTRADTVSASPH